MSAPITNGGAAVPSPSSAPASGSGSFPGASNAEHGGVSAHTVFFQVFGPTSRAVSGPPSADSAGFLEAVL